jgi:tetratricopeptide (TPR) repeat protein
MMAESNVASEFHRTLNQSARLLTQNRPGEAIALLLPLYQVAPEHPDVLINLSGAYVLQRRWNKAVEVLRKGVASHPDNPMLWMNLGAAELGRLETAGPRQQERAIAAYQRAIQVDAETPNAHYHLGLIYKERGELSRAAAFFQRALEVNPADRDARLWLDRLTPLLMEEVKQRGQGKGETRGAHAPDTETDLDGGEDDQTP